MSQSLPPPPSPQFDYEPDETKQKTQVAVGIAVSVIVLFSAPFVLLWLQERKRRKRRQNDEEEGDLGGTTVLTSNWTRREHSLWFGDTTLAASLPARSIEEKDGAIEEKSLDHANGPKPVTKEQILGCDKASFLRRLPELEAGSSNRTITAAPVEVPQKGKEKILELPELIHKEPDECVDPWSVEHLPNPVIFPHMRYAEVSGYLNVGLPQLKVDTASSSSGSSPGSAGPSSSVPTSSTSRSSNVLHSASDEEKMTQFEPRSPVQDRSSSGIESSNSMSISPTITEDKMQEASEDLSCNHCQISFATIGQLNAHINRKHIRRYTCLLCASAFHLKTDLQRHQRTVHKKDFAAGVGGFRCQNPGCSIPYKVFLRRDNFERHVMRCAQRLEIIENADEEVDGRVADWKP